MAEGTDGQESVDQTAERVLHFMKLFEKRLDAQEEMIANLMMAYQELWSGLEAVVAVTLEGKDEDEQARFGQKMGEYRAHLLKAAQEKAREMATRDAEAPPSVEPMDGEDETPSSEQ